MANGIVKTNTVIAVNEETTEGTADVPGSATDGYIQPLEDGFELNPSKELLEREILTSSIGSVTPRVGQKSVAGSLPVEFRASGTEGGDVDFGILLESALGNNRQVGSRTTTGAGHTTSVLNIASADSTYAVGDPILILESGDHSLHVCTAVDSSTLTYSPARSGAPSDAVEVAQLTTYFPTNTGHPTFTANYYWANEILEQALGCRVTSLSLDNFSTGGLASWNFGFEGLSFSRADGSAAHTPSYDSGLPPVILNACIFQDGNQLQMNDLTLSLSNTVAFKTDSCDANGKVASRFTAREITGTLNPYTDDTSVDQFDKFDQNTEYSLIVTAYTPSSTTGEIDLGTAITIYMPSCVTVEAPIGDLEGLLTDNLTYRATRGSTGDNEEIYIGLV